MKKFTLLFLWIFFSAVCAAQWSGDPSVNTFVAGTGLDRTYAKIAADPAGSFYVSHWATVPDSAVNFNVWLQRLDHQGNRLWGNDGIRISANPSRSWISGYDLTVDSAGNAVIAFEDMRAADGFSHVYLYCYDGSGNPVWDSAGVEADTGRFMSYSPVLAVTGKGNVLVAWNCSYQKDTVQKTGIRIMKYSPSGQPLWNGAIALNEPDSANMFPIILPVQEDDFILVWERKFEKGSLIGTQWYTYIRAQRFDSAGMAVWPQDVLVCDHGDSAYVMGEYMIVSTAE